MMVVPLRGFSTSNCLSVAGALLIHATLDRLLVLKSCIISFHMAYLSTSMHSDGILKFLDASNPSYSMEAPQTVIP